MADHIDQEIKAIKSILHALEPLTSDTRASVLRYIIQRLQIAIMPIAQNVPSSTPGTAAVIPARTAQTMGEPQSAPTHIKTLKEQKKPRSANEMAAVVAYYLANLVTKDERKEEITVKDIETYFKIAEFPLPEKTQFTLSNAKAAGYLDAVGNGGYKLNAVGYNLVVHSLPHAAEGKTARRRKRAKKSRHVKKL